MSTWRRLWTLAAAVTIAGIVTAGPAAGYGGDNMPPRIAISATVVLAGDELTVQGADFTPTGMVGLTLHSAPVFLGRVTADGNGEFSVRVTVPADTAPGQHRIEALDGPTGDVATASLTVQTMSIDPTPPLAGTGVDVRLTAWIAAALLVVGGACAPFGRRRGRPDESRAQL